MEKTNRTENKLIGDLKEMIEKYPKTIKAYLAQKAIDSGTIKEFLSDLIYEGIESGIVPELVYTTDIESFFDTHYDEIEEFRSSYEVFSSCRIVTDIKTHYTGLAIDIAASEMYSQLGFEEE